MSGPSRDCCVQGRNYSAQEGLRRRFAVWSLAIFGSLSSSYVVRLDDSTLWAADDPPAGSKSTDAAPANETLKPGEEALDRQGLNALIQAQKFDEAIARMDAALAAYPSPANYYLNYILALSLGQKQPDVAVARLNAMIEQLEQRIDPQRPSLELSTFNMSAQALANLLDRAGKSERALETIEKAYAVAERGGSGASQTKGNLMALRCRLLIKLDRTDEAKSLLKAEIDEALAKAEEGDTALLVSPAIFTYGSLFREQNPDEVNQVYERAERLLLAQLERDDAGLKDYLAYQSFELNNTTRLSQTSAKAADERLARLEERAVAFADRVAENEKTQYDRALQTLRARRSQLAAKLLHESLIGQQAPEFEIESVVNMDQVQWSDLKGKVVLIDFWAVWCGPCIATFPHLQHLQKEYGDRGLVIIGVTRQYGYVWDEEAQRAKSKKEATLEEEVAMLDQFRQKYELEHGFIVTPPGGKFYKAFGVTGIPQAVLVDQNGVIQLIRVGSGEQNAADIEAKIKELLGEKAEAAAKAAS